MLKRLAFGLFLVSVSPCLAEEPPVPNLAIESYRLPNGLRVVLHRDASVPRVTVCVAYHVGSKNERAGRTGFAHFFEHMMFRGTKNVPNYDVPLQETGAQSNAFTSEDLTVYFETVPSSFLDRALYLEAERLAFLPTALDQNKFDTEREVVKNERRQSYENVPYGLSEEALLAKVFPTGHPYSWSVIGSMKDLSAATLEDLTRFFAEFYHPGNASLCLSGDFDPVKAKATIARYFSAIPAGPAPKPVTAPAPPLARSTSLTLADKVTLPKLYWAWPTVEDDHPDAPALGLLAIVLSGGDTSRLHKLLVREAKVATEVDATSDTKEASGLFTIDATAVAGKTLDDVARVLEQGLKEFAEHPATADELARAVAKVEKSTFRQLTSPLSRAITLSSSFVEHDDPAHYRKDFARYYKVTLADLTRVFRRYLVPEKVAISIVPLAPGQAKSEAIMAQPLPGSKPEAEVATRVPRPGPDWATLPGPSRPEPWQPPKYTRKRLSNGVEVWVVPWKTLPIVEARLIIPLGTGDDPAGKTGLANLTATLIDKGTQTKTDTQLAEEFETLGVTLSASASADATQVGFSVLKRNLGKTLELVGEMLEAPRFDRGDFDRERGLELEALRQGPDSPGWIAQRCFRSLLFGPTHPYGKPGDGYVDTVSKLTLDDVRDFAQRLAADQSNLIVVGDVDPEPLVALLEKTLGAWKTKGPAPVARPSVDRPSEPGVVYLVDKPGAVQSVINVGRRWVDRKDPRYFAALLGNHVVGDDFLSRLNGNLREKNGYTYGAGSRFNYRRTGSTWQVSTNVRADVTAEALKEIFSELDGLNAGRPLTNEELATARDAEIRSFPDGFDDPTGILAVISSIAQFALPANFLDTYLEKLAEVPDAEIRRVIGEVVSPGDRTVLIVGDRATVEPRLKGVGVREIRLLDVDGKPVAR